jgi:hypothetical protein
VVTGARLPAAGWFTETTGRNRRTTVREANDSFRETEWWRSPAAKLEKFLQTIQPRTQERFNLPDPAPVSPIEIDLASRSEHQLESNKLEADLESQNDQSPFPPPGSPAPTNREPITENPVPPAVAIANRNCSIENRNCSSAPRPALPAPRSRRLKTPRTRQTLCHPPLPYHRRPEIRRILSRRSRLEGSMSLRLRPPLRRPRRFGDRTPLRSSSQQRLLERTCPRMHPHLRSRCARLRREGADGLVFAPVRATSHCNQAPRLRVS